MIFDCWRESALFFLFITLFYFILTTHDHGGTAVDQTKDRNRKQRYEESEWGNGRGRGRGR